MWTEILPFVLAASLGFRHAFETDHLLAVSNIVTKRNSTFLAMKDGTFWGLGHSSSILVLGVVMILLRWVVPDHYFQSMEGTVGVMIIVLGIFRLWQFFRQTSLQIHTHEHTHDGTAHSHIHIHTDPDNKQTHQHLHKLSFGVGIIHGLAGSGVLIGVAMAAMKSVGSSLLFLLIFSIGCMAGMMLASAVLGLPFSKKLQSFERVKQILVVISCMMCVVIGARIMMQNWFDV
ncbi:MAG: sulfite exporter TauE/SafE family protein [Chitinophagaceae bacterium]